MAALNEMSESRTTRRRALITGVAGQDGSYLAELLLKKGYEVHGATRGHEKSRPDRLWRLNAIKDRLNLHVCDVVDTDQTTSLFEALLPDEVYHLASDVEPKLIFEEEGKTFNVNFLGTINLLRAIKQYKQESRIYCAGSSLMFGAVRTSPQNEETPMNPTTPYGIAKVAAYHFSRMYREAYGIFVCTGILFNHESPLRDETFLPRKITKAAASIKAGKQDKLILGNIEAKRDWSFAGDVVDSMWLMLQQDIPKDYVIGSGELHSIKELLQIAFGYVGLNWQDYVVSDPNLLRKVEYVNLCADAAKARNELGWVPRVGFRELIEQMVKEDSKLVENKND